MADYYPLLARAIGGLPDKSEAGRNVVYERARRALVTQLRNAEPPLRDEDIAREQQSLEEAVQRLERDYAPDEPAPAPEPEPEPEPEPQAEPVEIEVREEPVAEVVEPAPVEPEPEAESEPEPAFVPEPVAKPPFVPPAAAFPTVTAPTHDDDDDYTRHLTIDRPERGQWPGGRDLSSADEFAALGRGTDSEDDPAFAAGETHSAEAAGDDQPAPAGRRGRFIGVAVVLVLLVAGAAVGFTQRETLVGWMDGLTASSSAPPAARPSATAQPEATKSSDRIAQAPSEAPAAGAAPTQAPAAQPSAPDGQLQGLDVAQRAVLFEESAGGGDQGLQQYVGNVLWSTETFRPSEGGEPDIGIRAVVTIPDRNIKATLQLRRNQDPSIPASHIVEVQFELPPNFDLGAATNVPGMRAKSSESAQGVPLTGLAVRVAPSYFLIGLSAQDADRQRNLGMLITRNFLDIPVVFENGRRAILVLDKGIPGDQAFRQAFMAWGLPVPAQNQP